MKKNLIYFGSPAFSAEILESLISSDDVNVVGVVTNPDKPLGRKQILTPSPVAQKAMDYDLPVYKPERLDDNHLAHIRLLKPDIFLVVSYGKIIPSSWLKTPTINTFNIHFSLLPKYRGALCIQEAIRNMDKVTGVTLMVMEEKLDAGPIVKQLEVPIENRDNTAILTTKLTHAAKQLLSQSLPEICAENYTQTPQNELHVTMTMSYKTLNHESAFVPSQKIDDAMSGVDAEITSAFIRSLNPEPGAWSKIGGDEIKILDVEVKDGKLVINTVQKPGKNPISWKQFLSGLRENLTN